MITEVARSKTYTFESCLPSNVCSHCGYCDDPESARCWPEDADGDRICWECDDLDGLAK